VFRNPTNYATEKLLENQTPVLSTFDVFLPKRRQRGVTAVAKAKGKRVALYLRVSTSEQITHNQRRQLQAVVARHKWDVVGVFEDAGISGAKGREQRPGRDGMMKVVARREVDMVAAWSDLKIFENTGTAVALLDEMASKAK
jgi:Resolvase, N terminal domain